MKSLKIALTADPEIPVPPRLYGGIERIIDMLAQGLVQRGHDVTVFAHPASTTAGVLKAWPGSSSSSRTDSIRNAATLARATVWGDFDLVHSFSRIAYMAPILPLNIPKIMSYQRAITPSTIAWSHRLSRGTLSFTAISDWMIDGIADVGRWRMIPNGVPLTTYTFRPSVAADAPLAFLGRLEETKGPHLAIEIARASGRRLVIAGNIPEDQRDWVKSHVLPHVDGDRIRYLGPLDDTQKDALLGGALAFLMPILWEEPFGIVMAEAMACGTPVLGLARGAVPEVVVDGVTGFVEHDVGGLIRSVDRVHEIDRAACRSRVESRYSDAVIVDAYEKLYFDVLADMSIGY